MHVLALLGVGAAALVLAAPSARSQDPPPAPFPASSALAEVPLALWTSPAFPNGVVFGASNGISFGDYDADGCIDVFVTQDARLWRNLQGQDWELAGDFNQPPTQLLPFSQQRYGCSFGDYDNDGLPDIAIEPRAWVAGDTCFRLLHNLGGHADFEQVAEETGAVITSPCGLPSETACWGDVDNDGDLDLFLPCYPPWRIPPGPGNVFWTNLGPVGPGGAYRFAETTSSSGLFNPPGTARPEGAQMCDVDGDGDLDLYSNGTLYQNRTTPGNIRFDALTAVESGISMSDLLDEGAMFFDYDLDGDQDLFVVYNVAGVVIWESRGDGTFFQVEPGVVQSPFTGLTLGMSAEDWDNDGDIDFTTRNVFRRNRIFEGERLFTIATHEVNPNHNTRATPAWGDWDQDGDLDCAMGNWLELGHFYENTLYGPTTPAALRRFVRVRPVRDSATVPLGLETEYGASVEVRLTETGRRRIKFTASGSGYLNQNEYALHFALPPDPFPEDPLGDLAFDVAVDFPGGAGVGAARVDRHVNPALGAIPFVSLVDREIRVFRSGRVRVNGVDVVVTPSEARPLEASAGGLALPALGTPLPAPQSAPADTWVGIAFDTPPGTTPIRVVQIDVDGALDAPVASAQGPCNVALWDVTVPNAPVLVRNGRMAQTWPARDFRASFPVNILLPPGRSYRLVAKVTEERATAIQAPVAQGALVVTGGLRFTDPDPASGTAVAAAAVDTSNTYLAMRFRTALAGSWISLGGGVGGAHGVPLLTGSGALVGGGALTLQLTGAAPHAPVTLVAGSAVACRPFAGGALLPSAGVVMPGLTTNASGTLAFQLALPAHLTPDALLVFQFWIGDASTPFGQAGSNAICITVP
jgi:hypothetical protein